MATGKERFNKRGVLASEAGQGTIEYILVIVVVLMIVGGGLYQLNQAFATFANNLFGEYLACLLETGELPALGNPQDSASSTCSQFFAAFDSSEAEPNMSEGGSTSSGGGASSGSGTSGDGSSSGGDSRSSQSAMNDRNNNSGSGGNVVNSSSSNGGRFGKINGYRPGQTRGSVAGRGSSGNDEIGTGNTQVSSYGFRSETGGSPVRQKAKSLDRGFGTLDNEQKKREKPIKTIAKTASGERQKEDKVFKIQRKPAARSVERDEDGFSFGDLIRYLIIAAIIIAILVFFGGQIVQVSNSMD